jgi:DNA-binding LytR/AlgR family response regulator
MLRALIVDDEAPAREELAWLLEQADGTDVEVQGHCGSAREVMTWLEEHPGGVDVIFLDINMPGVDGVRLAELLREREDVPCVVFVTAYDNHAVDAFDVDAVDYLLKPVRIERLQRALAKVAIRCSAGKSAPPQPLATPQDEVEASTRYLDRISVEERGVYRVVSIDDILFFEAEDGIVVVQTAEHRYITDFSLKFLEQNLHPEHFFRSHRSYIVKLDRIDSIAPWGAGTYRLVMDRTSDLGVPLARSRASELKSLIPWSASAFEDS